MDRAPKPERTRDLLSGTAAAEALSDAELCRRASMGEAEAFHAIFRRHGPAVQRFARSALRAEAEVDEAVQETFVRAHANLPGLKQPERLRAWLLGIARIVALDNRFFRRRDAERADALSVSGVVELDPTPEAHLLDAEAGRVLAREVSALAPHRRAALALRVDQELGYPEIAAVMGWPLQKVKNEIHRARLQIRGRILRYLRGRR